MEIPAWPCFPGGLTLANLPRPWGLDQKSLGTFLVLVSVLLCLHSAPPPLHLFSAAPAPQPSKPVPSA